jgi:hypothetical protein
MSMDFPTLTFQYDGREDGGAYGFEQTYRGGVCTQDIDTTDECDNDDDEGVDE